MSIDFFPWIPGKEVGIDASDSRMEGRGGNSGTT